MHPRRRVRLVSRFPSRIRGGRFEIGVSPKVADDPRQASPEEVGKVAAYAKEERPDLFHRAMGFYAEHPTLVKVLGTLAIASIAKNLYHQRPGLK